MWRKCSVVVQPVSPRLPESDLFCGVTLANYVWDLVPEPGILLGDWSKEIPSQTSLLAQLFRADISKQREHQVQTQAPLQSPVTPTSNNICKSRTLQMIFMQFKKKKKKIIPLIICWLYVSGSAWISLWSSESTPPSAFDRQKPGFSLSFLRTKVLRYVKCHPL